MAGKAAEKRKELPPEVSVHGAGTLSAVTVDSFNVELRDDEGFLGDRARRQAFYDMLERWRKLEARDLPRFGETPTADLSKSLIDEALSEGEPHEQALVLAAVDDYARELFGVIRRLLRTADWRDTERLVIGGGLSEARFTAIAVARVELLARAEGLELDLRMIQNHPDEAGLIGAAHLAPSWTFAGYDDILAIDIGGTNIRCGIVRLGLDKADDLSRAKVRAMELWRHADEDLGREEAVEKLVGMLRKLIKQAEKEEWSLAPFIGIGCPGLIAADGSIETGAQNLPGNWQSSRFNLPAALWEAIPEIGGHETTINLHNDAVVQGLSEVPFMQDVSHWGVLTIGTGLGNARFTNRARRSESDGNKAREKDEKEKGGKDKGGKARGDRD